MTNIAIDGPAGSGKSTVARMLARKLEYVYIDTGAMYRALTLKAIENNVDMNNEEAMANLANNTVIELRPGLLPGDSQDLYLDKRKVTEEIRRPDVSGHVSLVAQHRGVREKLLTFQQEIALQNNVVMDGRDIGTNVLPNAEYKFFVDADIEVRAERRHVELTAKGYDITRDAVREMLLERDHQDSTREFSPLLKAADAILIDTTSLTPEEVVNTMYSIIKGA